RIMLDMRISGESRLSRYCHTTRCAQPQPRGRTFEHDIAPEAHEPRRPPAGLRAYPAGFFDQTLVLDETSKILLVQPHPRQRLHRPSAEPAPSRPSPLATAAQPHPQLLPPIGPAAPRAAEAPRACRRANLPPENTGTSCARPLRPRHPAALRAPAQDRPRS